MNTIAPPSAACSHPGPGGVSAARRLGRLMAVAGLLATAAAGAAGPGDGAAVPVPDTLAEAFEREVEPRLEVPPSERPAYLAALQRTLDAARIGVVTPQFVVLVDRSPEVQALLLMHGAAGRWELVGATPVSTGLPGRFEHFLTPLGVFDHSLANPDYRAEGTKNENGIRGYGRAGMRVYDLGWVTAPKGWGNQALSIMRLQMHATDPDILEPLLGTPRSKGCIRIPAALNDFIDRRGLLDADYDRALADGSSLWVLRADRRRSADAGRYVVVVDTQRAQRPDWAVPPRPEQGDAAGH